jgi:hypothetical protein
MNEQHPIGRLTDLEIALRVIDRTWASTADVRQAIEWQRRGTPQIGKLAMLDGKLTMAQVFEILGEQAMTGGLFGEVAIEGGFLSADDVRELLQRQSLLVPNLSDALVATGKLTPQQACDLGVVHEPVVAKPAAPKSKRARRPKPRNKRVKEKVHGTG